MRYLAAIVLILGVSFVAFGQGPELVPQETLKKIEADGPTSLPKYLTEAERELPLPAPPRDAFPPSGEVTCPPEYALNEGIFFAWEGFTSLLTQMTVAITTMDADATVYMVVDSTSEQSSVASTLSSSGAEMDQVEFIVRQTDTVWIRDYGPRFVFEDGIRAIIDHTYNRPRPNDDALNDYVAQIWSEPEYDIPLTHGGGNFHLFGNGDAFMTELILDENPGMTEQEVVDLYAEYQGLNLTIWEPFPTYVDSTQHIDMWLFPVNDDTVIVGQYTFDPPRRITDEFTAMMQSRGYTVLRTPGWTSGGTHYTYTNAIVFNDIVFVPKFNVNEDAQAFATFQMAFPDRTCIQVDCSSIIHSAGAIHCICMHVPAYPLGPDPIVKVNAPNGGEYWTVGQEYEISWTARDDVEVTSIDILLSTDGGENYDEVIATDLADTGSHLWTVPAIESEMCRVKVIAYDADLNTGEDVSDDDFTVTPYGPEVVYSVDMSVDPGWSTEGLWAWGQPTGSGGQYGNPDPSSGYSGPNVYGYNLNGDYENNLPERDLTTGVIDCSEMANVTLSFWRYLNVEQPVYDHAYLRVSNDGTSWTTIWENTSEVTDSVWTYQEYDISAVADGEETVYIRWTMGTTDSAWRFSGWNIDDVELWAIVESELTPGDLDCDGDVDFDDINPFVLALSGQAGYEAAYPDCEWLNADCDDDGDVDFDDINPFVLLIGS